MPIPTLTCLPSINLEHTNGFSQLEEDDEGASLAVLDIADGEEAGLGHVELELTRAFPSLSTVFASS